MDFLTGQLRALELGMRERLVTLPEIALFAVTRGALGAGVALLLSDRLNRDQRNAAGWALAGVGAISTIPLVLNLLAKPPADVRVRLA
jgi:hypothetical protein